MKLLNLVLPTAIGFPQPVQAQVAKPSSKADAALNNTQSEMSACLAYYYTVRNCAANDERSADLAKQTDKTIAVLVDQAAELGQKLQMTPDAMKSRLLAFNDQLHQLMNNNCVNIASAYQRYAARCKIVVEQPHVI